MDVDNEWGYTCVGAVGISEVFVSSQFPWKYKTVPKTNEQLINTHKKK